MCIAFEHALDRGFEAARHRLLERTIAAMQPFVAQLGGAAGADEATPEAA